MSQLRTFAAGLALLWLAGCATAPQAPYRPQQSVHLQRPALEELPAQRRRLDGPPVRVLLRRGATGLKATAPGGLRLSDANGQELLRMPATAQGRLRARDGMLTLNSRRLGVAEARVDALVPGEDVRVSGRRYAGHLLLKVLDGELALINVVGLEDYVKGVLPGEVPADWPQAALRAQAVAARTFAASRMAKGEDTGFDVDDSTSSQVYKGRDAQKPSADDAVAATKGQVLTYNGKLADTFFHSNSGGHTANASDVWGGEAAPYLRGVEDPFSEDQKHYAWSARISLDQAEQRLSSAGLWQGLLTSISGFERADSGHWRDLELSGPGGQKKVRGQALRQALGGDLLKSTHFKVERDGESLAFEGRGWGHGVGLSQEGAFAMAQDGRDHRSILSHYYPGTRLSSIR